MSQPSTAYRLVRDVQNPNPDRRFRYQWEYDPTWKAGTVFFLRGEAPTRELTKRKWWYALPENSDRFQAIMPALAPIPEEEKDLEVILLECGEEPGCGAQMVLQNMLRAGRITVDDIRGAYELERLREEEEP